MGGGQKFQHCGENERIALLHKSDRKCTMSLSGEFMSIHEVKIFKSQRE